MKFIIAPAAEQDIHTIWDYIADDNVRAADALVEDFYKAFHLLADNPRMGYRQEPFRKFLFRFWTVRKRYQVIYRENSPIEIARVLSSYRDIFAILEKDLKDTGKDTSLD
jgi:plasmid stabilization system protein ParE